MSGGQVVSSGGGCWSGRSVSVGPQCVGVQSRSDISFRHKVKASSRRFRRFEEQAEAAHRERWRANPDAFYFGIGEESLDAQLTMDIARVVLNAVWPGDIKHSAV